MRLQAVRHGGDVLLQLLEADSRLVRAWLLRVTNLATVQHVPDSHALADQHCCLRRLLHSRSMTINYDAGP